MTLCYTLLRRRGWVRNEANKKENKQEYFWVIFFSLLPTSFNLRSLSREKFLKEKLTLHLCWSCGHLSKNIVLQVLVCYSPHSHTHTHISTSSCHAISTDISDPLSPLLPIVHRFRQVLMATPRILTELLYVGPSWSPCFCSAMWRGP